MRFLFVGVEAGIETGRKGNWMLGINNRPATLGSD
jgi:hypothetical protein